MMKYAVLFALLPTVVFAQQPSPEELRVAISALKAQREQALDQVVELSIRYAALARELEALKAKQPKE